MVEKKHIPNLLTMLRLALASVFFLLLALYQYGNDEAWLLIPAIVLFIAAALTDALDGHYARKWQVESKFGRIMDPFCDKVLIIGALCFLAGPGFHTTTTVPGGSWPNPVQHSGFHPWMVVVIIARELLVTGIRGEMEGSGHKFGANLWGKLKMILQAVAIPVVLLVVYMSENNFAYRDVYEVTRDVLVYATVIVTVLSGIPYVTGAYRVSRSAPNAESHGS